MCFVNFDHQVKFIKELRTFEYSEYYQNTKECKLTNKYWYIRRWIPTPILDKKIKELHVKYD